MDLVFVSVNTNPHTLLNICWCHRICQIYNKLCKLLNIDNVLGIIRVCINDFRASSNLPNSFISTRNM